jgi:hypothetical protein
MSKSNIFGQMLEGAIFGAMMLFLSLSPSLISG